MFQLFSTSFGTNMKQLIVLTVTGHTQDSLHRGLLIGAFTVAECPNFVKQKTYRPSVIGRKQY